jgi:UDP-N-acetylglucosamine 4-epimerase
MKQSLSTETETIHAISLNVIQMNELAMTTENSAALNTVYNTAFGDRNTLNDLVNYLKEYLAKYDPAIADAEVAYGPNRVGDIPHSLASIAKAKELLDYNPQFSLQRVERSDRLVLE